MKIMKNQLSISSSFSHAFHSSDGAAGGEEEAEESALLQHNKKQLVQAPRVEDSKTKAMEALADMNLLCPLSTPR